MHKVELTARAIINVGLNVGISCGHRGSENTICTENTVIEKIEVFGPLTPVTPWLRTVKFFSIFYENNPLYLFCYESVRILCCLECLAIILVIPPIILTCDLFWAVEPSFTMQDTNFHQNILLRTLSCGMFLHYLVEMIQFFSKNDLRIIFVHDPNKKIIST